MVQRERGSGNSERGTAGPTLVRLFRVPRSAICLRLSSAFDLADRDPRLPTLALARGHEHGGPGLEGADPGPLAAREVDASDARIAAGPRDGPAVEWIARPLAECGTECR